jgi:protein tyrosine phosphatase
MIHKIQRDSCDNEYLIYLFSAGVGRTGTFLAIDALYEHGQKTGSIDIME